MILFYMPLLDLKILLHFSLLYKLITINFLFGFLSPLWVFFFFFLRLICFVFSSCTEWGLVFIAVHGLLIEVASLVVKHRL